MPLTIRFFDTIDRVALHNPPPLFAASDIAIPRVGDDVDFLLVGLENEDQDAVAGMVRRVLGRVKHVARVYRKSVPSPGYPGKTVEIVEVTLEKCQIERV